MLQNGSTYPKHEMVVPSMFMTGTICLPLVTLLSKLGLKASPEKSVISSGWPSKSGAFL